MYNFCAENYIFIWEFYATKWRFINEIIRIKVQIMLIRTIFCQNQGNVPESRKCGNQARDFIKVGRTVQIIEIALLKSKARSTPLKSFSKVGRRPQNCLWNRPKGMMSTNCCLVYWNKESGTQGWNQKADKIEIYLAKCCVFRPAFGCCPHPEAGWTTFFSPFQR